jgi:hypothetical protein
MTKYSGNIRFEILAAVTRKATLFGDVTPCTPGEVFRRFGRNVLLLSPG